MATAVEWSTFSLTGVGHLLNQDRSGADGRLFCLADGMGGPAGGHVAATAAIRSIFGSQPSDPVSLEQAMRAANHAVRAAGTRRPGESEMGTTLTAVLVVADGIVVASVGDTRCYVSDSERIRQVTVDDTVAVDLGIPPDDSRYEKATSVLMQSLGRDLEPTVRMLHIEITGPTTVILSTDGVHEHVSVDDLRHDPAVLVDDHALTLVGRAQDAGSQDDASVIVIAIDP